MYLLKKNAPCVHPPWRDQCVMSRQGQTTDGFSVDDPFWKFNMMALVVAVWAFIPPNDFSLSLANMAAPWLGNEVRRVSMRG